MRSWVKAHPLSNKRKTGGLTRGLLPVPPLPYLPIVFALNRSISTSPAQRRNPSLPFSGHRHRYSQHLLSPPKTDVQSLFAFAVSANSPRPGSKKFEQASLLTRRVRLSRGWRTMGNFSPFFPQSSPIFPSSDLPSCDLEIVVFAPSCFSLDLQPF